MSEEKIQELLNELYKLTYDWSSGNSKYNSKTIDERGRIQVEQVIRAKLLDDRDERIGMLEAKVFAYEAIISNSNFAPVIKVKPNPEDK